MSNIERSNQIAEIKLKIRNKEYWTKPRTLKRKRSSEIWDIVHEIWKNEDDKEVLIVNYVACSLCDSVFIYDMKSSGTTTILNHTRDHKKNICNGNSGTNKINTFFNAEKRAIAADDRAQIKLASVKFVTKDLRPYEAVVGEGLNNLLWLMWNLGAKYGSVSKEQIHELIPSPQTVSRHVDKVAKTIKSDLTLALQNSISTNGLSITTDVWKDNFKRISYLCMTAHYFENIDNNLILNDQIISMQPLEVDQIQSGDYLKSKIERKLEELNIMNYKENITFTTDRGKNIVKAMESYDRLSCFPHFIHNVVKNACKFDELTELTQTLTSTVKYMKISGLNNLLKTSLKSNVSTRFNSVCDLIGSVIRNWSELNEILVSQNESQRLENIELDTLKHIHAFLSEFKKWSDHCETSKKPSLYLVWPAIASIKQFLQSSDFDCNIITTMKRLSLQYIEKSFVLDKFHRTATFLHPNLKNLRFTSSELSQQTLTDVDDMLSQIEIDEQTTDNSQIQRFNSSSSLLSFFYDQDCNSEIQNYLSYKTHIDDNLNISKWWFDHRTVFPKLSKLSLKIHAMQASSTASERCFSTSGNIITDKRSCLDPASIENIILLYKNVEKINKM